MTVQSEENKAGGHSGSWHSVWGFVGTGSSLWSEESVELKCVSCGFLTHFSDVFTLICDHEFFLIIKAN